MKIDTIQVQSKAQIQVVAQLADTIWREHFTAVIGIEQVNYMLAKYQNFNAIKMQIELGWSYYLFKMDDEHVAYCALIPDAKKHRVMLSKLYVRNDYRGKGLGSYILNFIEGEYKGGSNKYLWLTVNRFNTNSINWYKHHQFTVIDEVKKDIGKGYFMDDYIMEKQL